jgi:hypothetical protein
VKVDRIYAIANEIAAIERLWSMVTVFCEVETNTGRAMNLKRLKQLRTDIDEVINELEEEQENESWLD